MLFLIIKSLFTLVGSVLKSLFLAIFVLFPVIFLFLGVIKIFSGQYLNRYYVVSERDDGTFGLNNHPLLAFYNADKDKFFRIRQDAVEKFKRKYPEAKLVAITATIQRQYERDGLSGTPVHYNAVSRIVGLLGNYFLVFANWSSYRKRDEHEYQFAHMVRRINRTIPKEYIIINH